MHFRLVRYDVRVDAASRRDVIVPDRLTDPCPRDALRVQEADAAVPEVMRRECRYARGRTGARERRSQPVAGHALEHRPLRYAVITRHESEHSGIQPLGWRYPTRPARLRSCDSPTSARLVDIAPGNSLMTRITPKTIAAIAAPTARITKMRAT
jgi:hypothetical protein